MSIRHAEKLRKDWTAPAYAFYRPVPEIGYEDGRRFHTFRCAARGCQKVVRRFLDKGDRKSTGNLLKHARSCWGVETVNNAMSLTANEVREGMAKVVDGSITAHFERKGKGKITYSHRPHTKAEIRSVPVTRLRAFADKSCKGGDSPMGLRGCATV
jgi:hypothetical protein